ncbi:MAG: DUF1697 domain-containing protein [Sphingomicrobium sp.]
MSDSETAYVALLRAVNVGGRKLVMQELKAIADELGLNAPRTFIASGNLLFTSNKGESALASMLSSAIGKHMGADVPVLVRTAVEMAEVADANPFPHVPGNRVVAIFLEAPASADALTTATGVADERMALGKREIYVAYGSGIADSKLKIPVAARGTARNMNSVAKMAALLKEME